MEKEDFEKYYKDWHQLPEFQKKMINLMIDGKNLSIIPPRKLGRTYATKIFKKYFEGKY